ncbi:MAG: hypothetical protein U5K31_14180 [Balneolaceae bacterium]|nr:hypothetical protein [Balneolaceae bacterium]
MMFEEFFWGIGVLGILLVVIQIALLVLAIWLAFRFIGAQESMADSLRMIAREMYRSNDDRGAGGSAQG